MLSPCDVETVWPFVVLALLLLLCASVYLWIRSHIRRIDENQAEFSAWALLVTNRLNQLSLSRPQEPVNPNMKQFISDAGRALDEDSTDEIPRS